MKIRKYDEYHGIIEDDGHQFSFYWPGNEDNFVSFGKVKDYERKHKLTPMPISEVYKFCKALKDSGYWTWKERGFCGI